MRFEWDAHKNRLNIRKHGIDFNDVTDMFRHPLLTMRDEREDYGERRWISVGWLHSMVGVVVHTEREGNVIRIISARKATKRETRRYVESLEN
ncbi:BrnT family toxin [Pseudomonas guariconensis]|uniref:BrnT family toxin n=1 Tax=Pseudomonas guariconensis TaxID=1288410 RepID=UPI0018A9B86E|nr:BrnT family toxin [Pseudomonas guariconensis]MBF8722845.1 BrnT family toxin [Pseudomonas guariconensis]MBF8795515.1 BrnT family toxin [Pseudomonas monteilii]